MRTFVDDKASICVPFILQHLEAHRSSQLTASSAEPKRPLVVGLNGIQGVGKTTLVTLLTSALESNDANTVVCSIDDFYLTHDDQVTLAKENSNNKLVQHRGEPGTHDVSLATAVLTAIVQGQPTKIPQYDKAAFSGQGDRLPESSWISVNQPDQKPIDVVILEGWSVGFRSITPEQVTNKWEAPSRTLGQHELAHLLLVNEKLTSYKALTDLFDVFVHIDSENTEYVYTWRLEQEDHMRELREDATIGMTKEQVTTFVDGYYPAYELYTDGIRAGLFENRPGCQLRLIVGQDRKVKQVITI